MIDFQALLKLASIVEADPDIEMTDWVCETTHCMIGSWCIHNPKDPLKLVHSDTYHGLTPLLDEYDQMESIAIRFGITESEARWLFVDNPLIDLQYKRKNTRPKLESTCRDAASLSKDQALTRLRKFIYYKLKKQELITETGRNKQLHFNPNNNNAALYALEIVQ